MRSAEEMLDAVLSFARADDRILAVGMEGSRVNVNIPPDAFQDYDITYFVRSIGAFTGDDRLAGALRQTASDPEAPRIWSCIPPRSRGTAI